VTIPGDTVAGDRRAQLSATSLPRSRLLWLCLALSFGLVAVFGASVARLGHTLGERVRRTIIERDASVLHSVARREIVQRHAELAETGSGSGHLLQVVLGTARQEGMLAVVVFDAEGTAIGAAPDNLLAADLPFVDYTQLLKGDPISRFHRLLPLDQYFATATPGASGPVLEILLPLTLGEEFLGFAQYFIDARPLAHELSATASRVRRQTLATYSIGSALIIAVVAAGYFALRRAERRLRESHAHLRHANLELTLAAKTSAIGQITSHLLHSLKGSVAGLRLAMTGSERKTPDWDAAAAYTGRMQEMIAETLALLSDEAHGTSYLISGDELATLIRQRNDPAARTRQVSLVIDGGLTQPIDNHHGSLLCLMANSLIENAIAASSAGQTVAVQLREVDGRIELTVADAGRGVSPEISPRLFQPGCSGRPGGSGLGLAISRLIARQLGGDVRLLRTSAEGSVFEAAIPRPPPNAGATAASTAGQFAQ
jgi:signal transduction histidine kinase